MKKKKMSKILGIILVCFFLSGVFRDQVVRIAVTSASKDYVQEKITKINVSARKFLLPKTRTGRRG